jgi:hypothetical protein
MRHDGTQRSERMGHYSMIHEYQGYLKDARTGEFQVVCPCGWISRWKQQSSEAIDEFRIHQHLVAAAKDNQIGE